MNVIIVLPDFLAKIFRFKSIEVNIITAILVCLLDIIWGLVDFTLLFSIVGIPGELISSPLLGCISYLLVLVSEIMINWGNKSLVFKKAWNIALIAAIPFPITVILIFTTFGHIEKKPGRTTILEQDLEREPSRPNEQKALRKRRTKTKILFLSSNPIDQPQLNIEREYDVVEAELQKSPNARFFELSLHGCNVLNLQSYLVHIRPDIVHFSGHGTQLSEIVLINDQKYSQPVSRDALKGLFSLLQGKIQCVVLNACFSLEVASLIAEYIDCVVGTSNAISDDAAIVFSKAFYSAIGNGFDLQLAFELGRNQLDLMGFPDNVHMVSKRNNASTIRFSA